MRENLENVTVNKESGFYEPYARYSNLLRTWLVTYGVGAIAFLASQKTIVDALKGNSEAKLIIIRFFLGIVSQIFGAFLYKFTMGVIYHKEIYLIKDRNYWYKIAD